MIAFYNEKAAADRIKRVKKLTAIAWILAFLALSACVYVCSLIQTGNEAQTFFRAAAISTLAGWAEIVLIFLIIIPEKRMHRHERNMLNRETDTITGVIRLENGSFTIPRSIRVRTVAVLCGETETRLTVREDKARLLPANGKPVRVLYAGRYVAGFEEVPNENL